MLTYKVLLVQVQNKDQMEFVTMDSPFLQPSGCLRTLKEQRLLSEHVAPA